MDFIQQSKKLLSTGNKDIANYVKLVASNLDHETSLTETFRQENKSLTEIHDNCIILANIQSLISDIIRPAYYRFNLQLLDYDFYIFIMNHKSELKRKLTMNELLNLECKFILINIFKMIPVSFKNIEELEIELPGESFSK